jgi:hypothetical protein
MSCMARHASGIAKFGTRERLSLSLSCGIGYTVFARAGISLNRLHIPLVLCAVASRYAFVCAWLSCARCDLRSGQENVSVDGPSADRAARAVKFAAPGRPLSDPIG